MKKSIIGMVLLFFSHVVFTMQAENRVVVENHEFITIIIKNDSEEKEKILPIVSDLLNKYAYFEGLFLETKSVEMVFDSETEASAFQKIVSFIQNNDVTTEENFFETDDFVELIALAFKCDIEPLGVLIAELMKAEIKTKINECKTKILDNLKRDQIVKMCRFFSVDTGKKGGWFANAQKELAFYFHIIYLQSDPRIENIDLTYNANLFARATAARADAIHNNIKMQADEVSKREVEKTVSRICDNIVQSAAHEPCCERYKSTLIPRAHSSLASGDQAQEVVVALQNRLYAYDVFLNTDDWKPKSQLCSNERWPRTPGGYCASACGLCVYCVASPCQFYFCFLHEICCPDTCSQFIANRRFDNTQVAGAARHCVYKGATCFKRWIIIEPKDYSGEPVPVISPPREEML